MATFAGPVEGVNADLQRERQRCSFDVERMTNMLDGSVALTKRRRYLEHVIATDPTGIFDNSDNIYMHRTERHTRALAKHVRLIEICRMLNIGAGEEKGEILLSPDFPLLLQAVADDLPTSLHWVMFVPNIIALCDEEQRSRWLPLCRDWQMIGCYAQTELGHGSNVRGLETTATFTKGHDDDGSFIINSPTLTSTKFWPGTLGRTANYAIVMARLIDGSNIDRGVHNFLVQLRSEADHTLLPGVTTGDIGPKIGYNNMDNGYARFNNVVIPRRNCAMRFITVTREGEFIPKKSANTDAASKIVYLTMMQVRAHIVNEASKNLAMACTIAVRYSAVRRQGYRGNDKSTELQVLDYKQQQHRIFPLLAASYGFFFTGKKVMTRLKDIELRLLDPASAVSKVQVSDIHASSSCLKSYTTMVTADGIEECRKACGGHGFLACSGLPELFLTYLQSPTVEGDNHMLPQQVVKVLLKVVTAVQKNNTKLLQEYTASECDCASLIPSIRACLNSRSPKVEQSAHNLLNLQWLQGAFCHRAARLLVEVAAKLHQYTHGQGVPFDDAWNMCLIQMARVSRAYAQFLLLRNFTQGIQAERSRGTLGPSEVRILEDLALLLGAYWMEQYLGDFLEDGYVDFQLSHSVRDHVARLLDEIRPNAVGLVDARDFSDFRLKSALGRYDGNVYPAIMEAAKRDPLNSQEPGPGYREHLRRLIVDGVGKYKPSATITPTASRL
jgi:acyl-CoA oxidase